MLTSNPIPHHSNTIITYASTTQTHFTHHSTCVATQSNQAVTFCKPLFTALLLLGLIFGVLFENHATANTHTATEKTSLSHLKPTEYFTLGSKVSDTNPIAPFINYYPDETGEQTIETMVAQTDLFHPLNLKPIFGSTKMHWYRVALRNPSDTAPTWVVSTGIASALTLETYWVTHEGIRRVESRATLSHYSSHSKFSIAFTPEPHSQGHLFIKYSGIAQFPLDIQLLTQQQHLDRSFKYTLLNGITLGILFVFLLFFVIQLALFKRKDIAYYCLFILSMTLFAVHVFGYGIRFHWPEKLHLDNHALEVSASAIYLFYFLFSAQLFNHHKLLHRSLLGLSVITGVVCLFSLFFNLDFLLTLIVAVGMPIAIAAAFKARQQQKMTSVFFIVGSAVHYVCTCLLLLMLLGVPLGHKVFALSTLGQMIDIVCFSIAIFVNGRQTQKLLDLQITQRLDDIKDLNASEQYAAQMRTLNKDVILESTSTAHDLQQVLTSIRLQLALKPDTNETSSNTLSPLLQQTVDYASDLLSQRITKGKTHFTGINRQQDISQILLANTQRHQVAHPNLRVKTQEKQLMCSDLAINRILDNLISNAYRYAGAKGVLVTGRCRRNGYRIQVWDQGKGISKEKLDRIAEPFKQIKQVDIDDVGHGLGLHIVKFLCDEFGFTFSVQSNIGKGSCFTIDINDNTAQPTQAKKASLPGEHGYNP